MTEELNVNRLTVSECWRERMLDTVLRTAAYLGLLVCIPSMYLAWRSELPTVMVTDALALGVVVSLYRTRRLTFMARAWTFCALSYLLGLTLIMHVGAIAQIFLFGFSLLTALLIGKRAGFGAALFNTVTLLALGALAKWTPLVSLRGWDGSMTGWLIVTLNFSLVNILLTLAIGGALSAVNSALANEIAMRVSLDRERTLLRTLVDALPDVVFTKNRQGQFMTGNKTGLDLLGLGSSEELAGTTSFQLYDAAVAEHMEADDRDVLNSGAHRERESVIVDVGGSERTLLTIKVPLHDESGAITGLLGIGRDVTEQKVAEAERDQVVSHLQLQIARMPIAYIYTDRSCRFVQWNPAAERIFGFAAAEVIGKRPQDLLVSADERLAFEAMFAEIRAGNMDAHRELPTSTRNGSRITCEWHNTPLFDEQGEFAGAISLAVNVTERHKLEQQLVQSQKMEAVGKLAGGIAHDFNNLLTVILGCTHELMEDLAPDAPARDAALAINDAGQRAAALTRQLLAFSRRSILQPRTLDLNDVVREAEKLLGRLIGEDIQLISELSADLHPVCVDPAQLDQVLMNLAINARDAMPQGGRLTISTANVHLTEAMIGSRDECAPGEYVRLTISDTGAGMSSAVRARIFEPFYTTKAVGRGTGLGLAMVSGIVQQSGGLITVQSEEGQGATFTIDLPAATATDPTITVTTPPTDVRTGHETVLVVEDDTRLRELVFNTLSKSGYRILTAVDGVDAIRVAEAHDGPIDALLTDVVMPHASGPEVASAIRDRHPDVRVLFMSGYTDDAVLRHGLLRSEVAFIQKPYTPTVLARRLRETLNSPLAVVG